MKYYPFTRLYVLFDKIQGHHILCSSGNDDVSILLCRDAELLEGWLDQGGVLVEDMLQVSASLGNITQNTSTTTKD